MISLDVIDPSDPEAPQRMDRACRELGFFRIPAELVGDGIVEAAWEAATEFFDLPTEVKNTVAFPEPAYPYGYSPYRFETLAASLGDEQATADLKESFSAGPDCLDDPDRADDAPAVPGDEAWIRSPSQWPDAPAGLRETWSTCYRAFTAVSADLLAVMAVALDLDRNYFGPLIDRAASAMRALNYPALDGDPAPGSLRASAHSDYGTVTILVTDGVPGLEVQRLDGSWVPVAHVPNTYVVNLGDSIAQWTNDRWRSTLHRVTTTSVDRRQSLAFFHMANWDATIECLPTCHGPDDPVRYEPVVAGPWLMNKFTASVE